MILTFNILKLNKSVINRNWINRFVITYVEYISVETLEYEHSV